MNDIHIASILRTLSYADIFDYPLTIFELHRFLISPIKVPFNQFKRLTKRYEKYFRQKDGYYFLHSRNNILDVRRDRMSHSLKKLNKAFLIASILGRIPTLYFIGVSGSVAVFNAREKDDIDLFFITAPHTLWISRFLVNITLFLIGQKRKRGVRIAANKICPNMYISADKLTLSSNNLFVAHEVAQLLMLVNKKNTYEDFIVANRWVKNFLPNAFNMRSINKTMNNASLRSTNLKTFIKVFLQLLIKKMNHVFYKLQYYYMLPYKHDEKVSLATAFFHPHDKTSYVLGSYRSRYIGYVLKLVMLKKLSVIYSDIDLENQDFSGNFNIKN